MTATTIDIFAGCTDTSVNDESFEDQLRKGLPLWAQSYVTQACEPMGFMSGTAYAADKLQHNIDNTVRMAVVSAEGGNRYIIVLTESNEGNFYGVIVNFDHNGTNVELSPRHYIPVRIYHDTDGIMYVRPNLGRVQI